MSLKLLLWIVVLGWIYHRWLGGRRQPPPWVRPPSPAPEARPAAAEAKPAQEGAATQDMVQCARCGVYVPRQEGFQRNGAWYCSMAHRDGA